MGLTSMTRRIGSTLLVLIATVFAVTSFAAGATYQLKVDGLACPFCAYGIEKELNKIEGVAGLETHVKTGTVEVTMADGRTLTEARAREAVDKAGFTLAGFDEGGPGGGGDAE